jgi:hypothetical protein
MSRKPRIDKLIKQVEEQILEFEKIYTPHLSTDDPILKELGIQSVFVGLRSVLDYAYRDIIDLIIAPQELVPKEKLNKKRYFPYYAESKEQLAKLNDVMKVLHEHYNNIFMMIDRLQKYNDPKQNAVYNLADIANEVKHDDIVQSINGSTSFVVGSPVKLKQGEAGMGFYTTENIFLDGIRDEEYTPMPELIIDEGVNGMVAGFMIGSLRILNSKNIQIISCTIKHLQVTNSTVTFVNSTIDGHHLPIWNFEEGAVQEPVGGYVEREGKKYPEVLIKPAVKTVQGNVIKINKSSKEILEILRYSRVLIKDFIDNLYKELPA